MNIAIVCYHSMGGSGIIAYELGAAFAVRGHQVHFVGLDRPYRMTGEEANMSFHRVEMRDYPVFVYPPYVLALASRLYEVVERHAIDVIHCHYAMPHALAGLLARDMSKRPVKVVTTLHGTDITLVGSDPSFFSITKHAIERSDCVTAVSDFLRDRTAEVFGVDKARIRRIYNFVNPADFNPELPCGCIEGRNKR
ncbi:MAG: glycosyltransferase, partial [Planctomycetota bacterium]